MSVHVDVMSSSSQASISSMLIGLLLSSRLLFAIGAVPVSLYSSWVSVVFAAYGSTGCYNCDESLPHDVCSSPVLILYIFVAYHTYCR